MKCEHLWECIGGSRFDEFFECKKCQITKHIHQGIDETIVEYKEKREK